MLQLSRSPALPDRRTRLASWVPLVVVISAAVVAASLVVTTLSGFGAAGTLPPAARAGVGVVALLVMPGLPIAALLRLPTNGVFTAVAVSLSLAVNVLAAQLNYAGGLHQPYAVQYAVSAIGVGATAVLGRQWRRERETVNFGSALRWVRRGLAPGGNRRVSAMLLVAVVALFGSAVHRLDVDAAGSLGLLGVLGVDYYAGLVLLCVVLVIEYRRAVLDRAAVATANVVLIAYITMPVAWSMGTAPFVTAYVHRMITNWLIDSGALPPPVDARISWAGFFSAAANLITTTGLHDSVILLVSASWILGICLMFPVYAIGLPSPAAAGSPGWASRCSRCSTGISRTTSRRKPSRCSSTPRSWPYYFGNCALPPFLRSSGAG